MYEENSLNRWTYAMGRGSRRCATLLTSFFLYLRDVTHFSFYKNAVLVLLSSFVKATLRENKLEALPSSK